MNAFKKELAGMLLNDNDSWIAMEQVVRSIDEVLSNWTWQERCGDSYTGWSEFLGVLASEFVSKIQDCNILGDREPSDAVKEKMRLFIGIEKVAESEFEETLLDGLNEEYVKAYYEIKNS